MHIDKEKHKTLKDNYYKKKCVKTQLVLGTSLRKNDYHITRLKNKEFGKTKKWNMFTVSREGTVYQHFNDTYYSDFLGNKDGDRQTISIIVENMGYLLKTAEGEYLNWLNEQSDKENVLEKKWLSYKYWEKIQSKQMEASLELCEVMCEKHHIPKVCVDFQNYHKDIHKFRGIVFRSNYLPDTNDLNPQFEPAILNEMLRNKFL